MTTIILVRHGHVEAFGRRVPAAGNRCRSPNKVGPKPK
jgi:hypothetical protein